MADVPSDEQKGRLIQDFSNVTGLSDPYRARFYLESAGWNIDLAAGAYFEDGDGGASGIDVDPIPAASESNQMTAKPEAPPTNRTSAASQSKPSAASSRFATISSLAHDEPGSDSDDETGETYYAGGSERGAGQQVIGPPRKGAKASGKLIDSVFKAAKERGAETVEDPSSVSGGVGTSSRPAFHGTAYRLGDSTGPSQLVEDSAAAAAGPSQPVDITLNMWKNGFSVDDGPLRDFHSPEGREFIECITRGEVPRELIRAARGAEVAMNMVDRRTEDYVAPKKKVQCFSGEGHRLGSPTDVVTVPAAVSDTSSDDAAKRQKAAEEAVAVDTSSPTTSIQIRLTDGSRLVGKFNQTHTVSDVRQYIVTARPEYDSTEFTLMTTFPNREVTDESQSLAAAGLLNAVLVVKTTKK